ncbi:MAG: hypothetical protein PGN37_12280 [Mycobacterium kyogaense]|uniref:hypothetical protein n=1 Tax=Mycobacterium kyogaense TaxID=2212479 RepID=UPI002FFBC22D
MDPGFEELWAEIGERPGDPDGPDQADIFFEETDGLWPMLYDWLLHGLLVRDAVSAFEVYFDKVTHEALRSQGLKWSTEGGRSPDWDALTSFWRRHMAVKVETNRMKTIRRIRNILTHQRGELRTDELRRRFGGRDDLLPDNAIRLSQDEVLAIFDDLSAMVEKMDTAVRKVTTSRVNLNIKTSDPNLDAMPESGGESRIPTDLLLALTDALARWDEWVATSERVLEADTGMASAIRSLLDWHNTAH